MPFLPSWAVYPEDHESCGDKMQLRANAYYFAVASAVNEYSVELRKGVHVFMYDVYSALSSSTFILTKANIKANLGGVDIDDLRVAIFLCGNEGHWYLAVVMIKESVILMMDSKQDEECLKSFLAKIHTHQHRYDITSDLMKRVLEELCGRKFSSIDVDVPPQPDEDGYNCGLFDAEYISHFLREPKVIQSARWWFSSNFIEQAGRRRRLREKFALQYPSNIEIAPLPSETPKNEPAEPKEQKQTKAFAPKSVRLGPYIVRPMNDVEFKIFLHTATIHQKQKSGAKTKSGSIYRYCPHVPPSPLFPCAFHCDRDKKWKNHVKGHDDGKYCRLCGEGIDAHLMNQHCLSSHGISLEEANALEVVDCKFQLAPLP